jgi:glycerol-3-phosphate acyltransferase PlsX
MIVALDAMGGDHGPSVNVEASILTVNEFKHIDVLLVGKEDILTRELNARGYKGDRISIHDATETVDMDESPSLVLRRKKDSSLRRAVEMVRDGKADAAVSAGNSGAMMALGLFLLRPVEGVDRPALAAAMPSEKSPFLFLDLGANVDCSSENLFQFACMGSAYANHVMNIDNPRVALLSIGEEANKGNELTKDAYKLLEVSRMNFIGNIESKAIFRGEADVVVCDGFPGNVFLKTTEGLADILLKMIKQEIMSSTLAKIGYLFMRSAMKNVARRMDYDEYGGATLLGLNGACIITHGRASAKAIMSGIREASDYAEKKVYEKTSLEIRSYYEPK